MSRIENRQGSKPASLKQSFPENLSPDDRGIVAFGGTLNADLLIDAYSQGVFPWPEEGLPMLWFSPHQRGVIPTDQIHISRSLKRSLRKLRCRWTWNTSFPSVIRACREISRPGQQGTWITEELLAGYIELFQRKRAYSLECWMPAGDQSGAGRGSAGGEELVAGIYGVWMGKFVSGESMFSRVDDGSKAALCLLGNILRGSGIRFLDTQMVSGVVEAMGGIQIGRAQFLDWVGESFQFDQEVPDVEVDTAWKQLLAEIENGDLL